MILCLSGAHPVFAAEEATEEQQALAEYAAKFELHRHCPRFDIVDGIATRSYYGPDAQSIVTERDDVTPDTLLPFSYRGRHYMMPFGIAKVGGVIV